MAAARLPGDRHPVAAVRFAAAAGLATVAGLALAACSQGPADPVNQAAVSSPAAASTGPSTGTAQGKAAQGRPPRPTAPLTGLPAASGADATRPAVALAVAGSSPQGLGSADVVFEEITTPVRYIAVYQSRTAAGVGPITTTRPVDSRVLSVLHPLFGYAGGSGAAVRILDKTKVTDLGGLRYPSLYTSTPQGLTASTQTLMTAAKDGPPPPLFSYRGTGADTGGRVAATGTWRATSVQLTIPGSAAQTWNYDAHSGRWSQSGGPAAQVTNLVIQTVPYRAAFLDQQKGISAPSAVVIGTGNAEVLSGDMAVAGIWAKRSLAGVTNYIDKSGSLIELEPGPTWVVLVPPGAHVKTTGGRS
jgi:hypothetical protein